MGVAATQPGSRASHEAAKASSPEASIPNAAFDRLSALRTMCAACGQPFYVEILDEALESLASERSLYRELISEESIEALAEDIACAVVEPRSDVVAMRHSAMVRLGERLRTPLPIDIRRAAQAIEARRAETVEQGSVADESADGNADAPVSGNSFDETGEGK